MVVATGKIVNADLELFDDHIGAIVDAPEETHFVALTPDRLIVHGDRPD